MPTDNLTSDSLALFLALCEDAPNWSGTPIVDGLSPADKGNLTDLKVKGLLTTHEDEGVAFVWFTDAGASLATEHGHDASYWPTIERP